MAESALKAGDILVADKLLGFDPDFGGSVILLLAHGNSTVGINIASGHIRHNLFAGGPLRMPYPIALHAQAHSVPGSRPVGNSGYAITELDGFDVNEMAKPKNLVLAAGYAGWGPGQLETEIAQGVWKKVEGTTLNELLAAQPAERWKIATEKADAPAGTRAPKDKSAPKSAQSPKP